MAFGNTASADITLLAVDGATRIPLMLAEVRDDKGNVLDRTIDEVLAAASADSRLGDLLEPAVQRTWARGAGLDYDFAAGLCTRMGVVDSAVGELGQVVPAGAATEVNVTTSGSSFSRIVAIEEYNGDRYVCQVGDGTANTARVMKQTGGTGALANVKSLGAGEYIRGAVTADDGSGNPVLFVTSSDTGSFDAGKNGKLHKYDLRTGLWTSTPAGRFGETSVGANDGTAGRNAIVKVNWTIDGVSAWRLVCITGPNTIAYTRPFSDPMTSSAWVEGVKVDTTAGLMSLAAARHHVWAGAGDGLFDLDEQGNTPNLIGYEIPRHPLNGACTRYYNDYVYMNVGNTLHRIFVGEAGALQAMPGACGPCWGTAARNPWSGPITALGEDQGYLIAATFNYATSRAAVWYGIDRDVARIDSPNPIVWHGPEIVGSEDLAIFFMRTTSLGAGLGMNLWLTATPSTPFSGDPWMGYVSVPLAGSSLADLISGGAHRFATGSASTSAWNATCQLWSLPEAWQDPVANKIIDANGINSAGLGGNTRLDVYNRADPAPGSTDWGTGVPYTLSPVQNGAPVEATQGYQHEYRVDFFGDEDAPAVLNAVRRTALRRVPALMTYQMDVEYGDGVTDLQNGRDEAISPDQVTTLLKLLTEGGRTTLTTPLGQRYTVVLKQMLAGRATFGEDGPYGKRVRTRLTVALLAEA